MERRSSRTLLVVLSSVFATLVAVALVGLGYIYAGAATVAASQDAGFKGELLHTALHEAVEAETEGMQVPALNEPKRLERGAGHYDAMCATCHGAPGVEPDAHAEGMHPHPPALADHRSDFDDAGLFYIIKHGIQMTGMPAWSSEKDEAIWDMVALLRAMPDMESQRYRELVEAGGAHGHHAKRGSDEGHHDEGSDGEGHHGEGSHGEGHHGGS